MNKIIKKAKKVVIALSLIIINIASLQNGIYAFEATEGVAHKVKDCGEFVTYNGEPQQTSFIEVDGHPTYREERPDAGEETEDKNLTIKDVDSNFIIWRIITNGYPYQDLATIGVDTEEEAYTATQHAIYLYLEGDWKINDYAPIGDQENSAGARVIKAIQRLLKEAEEGTNFKSPNIVLIDYNGWECEGEYIKMNYNIKSEDGVAISNYKVSLSNSEGNKDLSSIKIVNENGEEKDTFESQEKFSLLMPIKSMTESGSFNVNVTANMKTKPILGGESQGDGKYYYIAGLEDEEGCATLKQNYSENLTNLIIQQRDKDTEELLKGEVFQLLDEKQNVIYSNLETNENDEVELDHIMPGIYYLKQIKAPEGYKLYNELIKIDIKYLSNTTVIVKTEKLSQEQEIPEVEAGSDETTDSKVEVTDNKEEVTEGEVGVTDSTVEVTESEVEVKDESLVDGNTNKAETTTTIEQIKGENPPTATFAAGEKKLPVAGM